MKIEPKKIGQLFKVIIPLHKHAMKKILLLLVLMSMGAAGLRAQETFNGRMVLTISGTDIKEPMDVTYYFLNDEVLMKPQIRDKESGREAEMGILFKPQQQVFFILMGGKDGKMAMRKSYENINEMLDTTKVEQPKITQTNETKRINGYLCRKVIAETSTSIMDMWVTNDLKFSLGKLMAYSSMGKGRKKSSAGNGWGSVKGASLETVVTDKERGSVSTILVKEISTERPSADLFDITSYQVMEMPSLKGMMPFGKKK
jgi:hypothetical protein